MSIVGQAFVEILPVSTGFASALERQLKDASDKATKNSQGVLGSLANVGKAAAVGLVASTVAVGAASIKMASDFQSAAVHLVTDAGESASNLKMVQNGMLAISQQTGTTAKDIVNGMYHIESAGYHGAAGLQILKVAAEGAKVGGADLDTVSKTLTGTMRSYNIPAGQAVNVMNELVAAVGSGDMRMQDLASSLGNVTPIAAAAGLSLAQVTGAVATMTAQNMSAQQATQDVANTIRALQAPTTTATQMMAQFGLNSNDVSKNLGSRGLTGTLSLLSTTILQHMGPSGMVLLNAFNQSQGAAQDMQIEMSKMPPNIAKVAKSFMDGGVTMGEWRKIAKGLPADQRLMMQGFMSTYSTAHRFNDLLRSGSPDALTYNAALEKMLGGATGLNTALMLTGSNFPAFTKNVSTIADAAKKGGDNVDNWAMIQKTFAQQMDSFKVTIQDLMIKLGIQLIPVVEKVAKTIANVVGWFMQHKDAAIALGSVIGGFLTVTISAFTAVTLAHLFGKVKDGIKIFQELGTKSISIIGNIGKFMLANPWLIAIALVATAAFLIITHWKEVSKFFERLWHDVAGFFQRLWKDIYNGFIAPLISAWNTTVAALTGAFDAVRAFFVKWWPVLLPLAMTLFLGPLGLLVGVIVDEIILHWHTLMHITEDVFNAIGDAISFVWHYVSAVAKVVLGPLIEWIGIQWNILSDVTTAVWDAIKLYFKVWWDLVKAYFTIALAIIEGVLETAWNVIRSVVITVWDGIKAYFTIWWDVLKAIISVAWDAIKTIFTVALDLIEGKWGAAWGAIESFFSATWNTIKGTAESVWGAITGFFTGAFGEFESFWGNQWKIISFVFGVAFSAVVDLAKAVWKDVHQAFEDGISVVERIINDAFISPINTVLGVFGVHIGTLGGGGGGGGGAPAGGGGSNTAISTPGGMKRAEHGGVYQDPTILVGEGRKGYPEFVIPSDPAYHGRARWLLGAAGRALGLKIPGLGGGGIWGTITGAAGSVGGAVSSGFGAVTGAAGSALHWVGGEAVGPAIDAAVSAVDAALPGGFIGHMASGAVHKIASTIKAWVAGHHTSGGIGPIPTGQQKSLIDTALKLAGVSVDVPDEAAVNVIVSHESGWNPRAINTTDINAQQGDPSRGLMQTIMTTFEAYRLQNLPDDIYDPLANMVAGIRYAVSRYGSLLGVPGVVNVSKGGQYVGYDSGGLLMPGFTPVWNGTGRPEVVLPPGSGRSAGLVIQPGGIVIEVQLTGNTATSTDVVTLVKQGVEQGITEALTEVLDHMDAHNLAGTRP